jgi:hypothetical protein
MRLQFWRVATMLYWVTYVVLVLEKAKKLNAILETQWPSFENRDNESLCCRFIRFGNSMNGENNWDNQPSPPTLEKLKGNGLQSSLFA